MKLRAGWFAQLALVASAWGADADPAVSAAWIQPLAAFLALVLMSAALSLGRAARRRSCSAGCDDDASCGSRSFPNRAATSPEETHHGEATDRR